MEELAQQGRIRELILDQYANYVVQRALTVANNEEGLKLVNAIRPHLHSMQVTKIRDGKKEEKNKGDRLLFFSIFFAFRDASRLPQGSLICVCACVRSIGWLIGRSVWIDRSVGRFRLVGRSFQWVVR